MDSAHDDNIYVDDRTIDSHIKRLRKKHRSRIPAILLTGDVEIRHGPESTATAVVIAYKPLSREKLALLICDTVSAHAVQHP